MKPCRLTLTDYLVAFGPLVAFAVALLAAKAIGGL